MAQITELVLPDGRKVRPEDWSTTPIYTTVDVSAGANLQDLQGFSYGIGGPVPGSVLQRQSTLRDTNLDGSGSVLPDNQELNLFAIRVELFAAPNSVAAWNGANEAGNPNPPQVSLRQMLRMQRDIILKLVIAEQKNKYQHPLGFFPGAMGVHGVAGAITNNQSGTPATPAFNGGTSARNERKIGTPYQIKGGQAFSIALSFPLGTVTGLNLGMGNDSVNGRYRARIYADGYRQRPAV